MCMADYKKEEKKKETPVGSRRLINKCTQVCF
jgi:hypothetical protein